MSPPGDHQANGAAEQGVRLAQGAARTLLARVAQALGMTDVPETSPLIPYAARHGAWLYNRFHMRPVRGHTGDIKTAWDELRGKSFEAVLAEIGERIRYLRPDAERHGKLSQKYGTGLFVGREDRTGRVLALTEHGLVRADKFLRFPEGEQWDRRAFDAVRGVPWDKAAKRALGTEEEEEEEVPPLPSTGPVGAEPAPPRLDKRPTIKMAQLREFGATPGCPGSVFR